MAQKVTVTLEDDLDGGLAEHTMRFAFDGTAYEIDLSASNADEMRKAFAPYVAHARRAGGVRAGTRQRVTFGFTPEARRNREKSAAVRAWAKEHGIRVSERGRIPAEVVAQYEARNAPQSAPDRVTGSNGAPATPPDRETIRTWAKGKGLPVKARGILSAAVVKQYNEAHGIG